MFSIPRSNRTLGCCSSRLGSESVNHRWPALEVAAIEILKGDAEISVAFFHGNTIAKFASTMRPGTIEQIDPHRNRE